MQAEALRRLVFSGLLLGGLLFSTWAVLAQVNWRGVLHVEEGLVVAEAQLGSIFLNAMRHSEKLVEEAAVLKPLNRLVDRLCAENRIPRQEIHLYVLKNPEVNAFAFPGGNLVIHTGLLERVETPEELCGVLAHEIAHIELRHVRKKLSKELGLVSLVSMTTGGAGSELVKETLKVLSSSAFDRRLEMQADQTAIRYLQQAEIDPKPFADCLQRLSDSNQDGEVVLKWFSSHPDSRSRAKAVQHTIGSKVVSFRSPMSRQEWSELKKRLKFKRSS